MSNEDVLEIIRGSEDPQDSCRDLIRESAKRYRASNKVSDNITIVIVHFLF